VNVVFQMTADALLIGDPALAAHMAVDAADLPMEADQRESGDVMVEGMDDVPARFVVAAGAVAAEAAAMNVLADVAVDTGGRRCPELRGRSMAVLASDLAMPAAHREVA
jgi:hypothetical protein